MIRSGVVGIIDICTRLAFFLNTLLIKPASTVGIKTYARAYCSRGKLGRKRLGRDVESHTEVVIRHGASIIRIIQQKSSTDKPPLMNSSDDLIHVGL